jgi:hypothetical protein
MSGNWLRCAALAFLAVLCSVPRGFAQDNPVDIYFAHFASGDGYLTTFTLINTGTTAATGFLMPHDSLGRPFNAVQITVPPHGTNRFTLGSSGSLVTGWATYSVSGGQVSGFATFQLFQSGVLKAAAGVQSSKPSLSVTIPAGFTGIPFDQHTGFALANPGTVDVTVRVAAYSSEGVPAGEPFTLTLGPNQQKAQFLQENFPDLVAFDGTLVVTSESGGPFLATALSQIQGSLAMLPVLEN